MTYLPLILCLVGVDAPPAAPDPGPAEDTAAASPTAPEVAPALPPTDPSPPKVETSLSPKEVRIGEHITFEIIVTHDGTRSFRMPDSLDFGKVELIERHAMQGGRADGGMVTDRHEFTLAVFEPGRHAIPDFELPYVDVQGREYTVPAKGGVVICKSVLANVAEPELKPPPGPIPLILEDRRPLYVAGVLGVVLLAGMIAFVMGRFLRGRAPEEPPPPSVPAEVIALGRLQTLRARNLPRQGLLKEFYLELSHILREYFGNRFQMAALEMTTDELLGHLTEAQLHGVRKSVIERFLGESDLVKFAKYLPTDEEVADVFLAAEDIVFRTTPRRTTPNPDPAAAAGTGGNEGKGEDEGGAGAKRGARVAP